MFAMLPPDGTPKAQFYSSTVKNGQTVKTYSHYAGNLYDKYGDSWPTRYREHAASRMRSWGFNTVGTASSAHDMANQGLPFTVTLTTADYPTRLQTPFAYWRSLPDPFGTDFPAWLQANLTSQLGNLKNNPNLLGVFVDGENSWGTRSGSTRERYQVPLSALAAPTTQPAKQAFVNHLFVKYRTIEALNQAWDTNFGSWQLMRTTAITLTDPQVELATSDLSAFLWNYVKAYAFRVRQAVKGLHQDLLWLGTREYIAWAPNEVFSALQQYADTISVTHYDRAEDVPWSYFNALKRPVLISEFTFAAREGNSMSQLILQRCETSTQAGRAALAASYLDKALTSKNVIGCHWFTYIDQPISGKFNGENNAFGLVDVTDRPYTEMVSMFRNVSNTMYSRRGL
jgi:agarase